MTILTQEQEDAFKKLAEQREMIIDKLSEQGCHSFDISLMPQEDYLKLLETIQNFYKKEI